MTRETSNVMHSKTTRGAFTAIAITAAAGALMGGAGVGMARAGAAAAARESGGPAPAVRRITDINDVMEGKSPPVPSFPKLAPKPGYLRGYVKDPTGKPVVGAWVMARSSAVGGFGSSAKGKTDAKGYYEIPVPWGVARVWCAGHAMTYHGVRIAVPLHPADGEVDDFATKKGHVENMVLWTYGTVSEAGVSENPTFSGNYYGASFSIGYTLREGKNDLFASPGSLNEGAEIEVKLTPEGPLLDGSRGETLLLRKKLTDTSFFQVNNVPIGRYRIEVRMVNDGEGNSGPLRLRDNSRHLGKGGLEPKESENGVATVVFRSDNADPAILRVTKGNMERLSLLIDRVEK